MWTLTSNIWLCHHYPNFFLLEIDKGCKVFHLMMFIEWDIIGALRYMALKLHEGDILSKDKVSEAWSANVIPSIFFTILLSTHLVNSKPVISSLGYRWHVFLCFEEIRESCFWDILLQISKIFHDQTKSVMNLKKQLYYIDMIMYHCNFFEVDPRTLESPHGTFLQRLTVNIWEPTPQTWK